MKRIAYMASLLFILAGCTKENAGKYSIEAPVSVSILFQTKAGGTAPVVNSVRVVAFDSEGKCSANVYTTSGFSTESVTGGLKITLDDVITLAASNSNKFDVYAILNEGENSLVGTDVTLKSLLDAIAVGGQKQLDFNNYLATPVKYTPAAASGTEPAFLMSVSKTVNVTPGSSITPFAVDFSTSASDNFRRNMAQVTITGITSASTTSMPKVIVRKVELVNVPSAAAWGSSEGNTAPGTTTIQVGAPNTDNYYDRTFDSDPVLTQDWTVNATKTSTSVDSRKYYATSNDGKSWSWTEPTPPAIHNKKQEDAENQASGIFAKTTNDAYAPLITALEGLDDSDFSTPVYAATSIVSHGMAGESEITSTGSWNITLGDSFYVPENVSTGTSNATCIHVRLSLMEPSLNLDGVQVSDLPVPTSLTSTSSTGYFMSAYESLLGETVLYSLASNKINVPKEYKNGVLKYEEKNTLQYLFPHHGHYESRTYSEGGDNYNFCYAAWVTDFIRQTSGTAVVEASSSLTGATIEWEMGTDFWDFYIPVNNKSFGGDYSVRRNTKYTVNLHVDDTTFGKLTKSSPAGPGLGISASVTAEKSNDYED